MTRVFIYSPLRVQYGANGYSCIVSPGSFRYGALVFKLLKTEDEVDFKKKSFLCGLPGQSGIRYKIDHTFYKIEWVWISKSLQVNRFSFQWNHSNIENFGTFLEKTYIKAKEHESGYIQCIWNVDHLPSTFDEWVEITWRWNAQTKHPIQGILSVNNDFYPVGSRCIQDKFIEWRTYWKPKKRENKIIWTFQLKPDTLLLIHKMVVSYHTIIYQKPITDIDFSKHLPMIDTTSIHWKTMNLTTGYTSNLEEELSCSSFYEELIRPSFGKEWDVKAKIDRIEKLFEEFNSIRCVIDEEMIIEDEEEPEEEPEVEAVCENEQDFQLESPIHIKYTPVSYDVNDWEYKTVYCTEYLKELPKISIIVLFRGINTGFLRRCLWSLYNQTLSLRNFEVLVGFDGNKTIHFKTIEADLPPNMRVQFYSFIKWRGICEMNHFLLGKSMGKYIGWVDHDDTLEPSCLENVISEYEKNSETNVYVYTNFNFCNQRGIILKEGSSHQPVKSLLEEQCGNHFRTISMKSYQKLKSILFPDELKFGAEDQDLLFIVDSYASPKFINKPLYNYFQDNMGNLSGNVSISTWLLQWSILRNVFIRSQLKNTRPIITLEVQNQLGNPIYESVFELVFNNKKIRLYICYETEKIPLKLSKASIKYWNTYFNKIGNFQMNVEWKSSALSWIPAIKSNHFSSPYELIKNNFSYGVFPGVYWDIVILWTDKVINNGMIDFGNMIRDEWGCSVEIWGPWEWSDQLKVDHYGRKSLFWYFHSLEVDSEILLAEREWHDSLMHCALDWKIQFYNVELEGPLEYENAEWGLSEYNHIKSIDLHLLGLDFHAWEWLYSWAMKETDGKIQYENLRDVIFNRLRMRYEERRRGEVWFRFKDLLHKTDQKSYNDSVTLVSNESLLVTDT